MSVHVDHPQHSIVHVDRRGGKDRDIDWVTNDLQLRVRHNVIARDDLDFVQESVLTLKVPQVPGGVRLRRPVEPLRFPQEGEASHLRRGRLEVRLAIGIVDLKIGWVETVDLPAQPIDVPDLLLSSCSVGELKRLLGRGAIVLADVPCDRIDPDYTLVATVVAGYKYP